MQVGEFRGLLEKHNIKRVKLGAFDIDCTLRGKYVSTEKFLSAAQSGMSFCDVIFGWDIGDVLYDNAKFTGWHTGYPDAGCRIALDTFRLIPWEPGTAFFLMDFVGRDGEPLAIAPRQVLERVVKRAAELGYTPFFSAEYEFFFFLGYTPFFSAEYEFFFFRETPESLRAKNFRNLTPLTPGMFGYSILRASGNSELVLEMIDQLTAFNCAIEGLHTETGPGVYEAAIAVDEALGAADKAALFKTAIKEIAARHSLIPTFMAKWNPDLPGSSGHLHQSLWDHGKHANLFHSDDPGGMSELMRHYIAGLVANLPELAAVICPTINSYKRTVPGAWAPVNSTWVTRHGVRPAGVSTTADVWRWLPTSARWWRSGTASAPRAALTSWAGPSSQPSSPTRRAAVLIPSPPLARPLQRIPRAATRGILYLLRLSQRRSDRPSSRLCDCTRAARGTHRSELTDACHN